MSRDPTMSELAAVGVDLWEALCDRLSKEGYPDRSACIVVAMLQQAVNAGMLIPLVRKTL